MQINLDNLTDKKKQSLVIANLYQDIGMPKHSYNVANCQNFMKFLADQDKKKYKLLNRCGCKDRYCSNCQRAYYLKNVNILSNVASQLAKKRTRSGKHSKYSLLFITVTVPNAKPTIRAVKRTQNKLKNSVRKFLNLPILKGWGKDKHGHACHGRLLGALAKFEQTVNHHNLSLNLHCHILVIIHSDYFVHYYLSQSTWSKLWKLATGHNYLINVEASYYKDKCGRRHDVRGFSSKSIKEMSKYETKSQDFLSILKNSKNNFVGMKRAAVPFKALVYGLSGTKRYIAYGLFRKLIREFKANPATSKDTTAYAYKTGFRWHKTQYNSNFVPLTDKEKIALLARGIHTTPFQNTYLNSHKTEAVNNYIIECNKQQRHFRNNRIKLFKNQFNQDVKFSDKYFAKKSLNEYIHVFPAEINEGCELFGRIMTNLNNPKQVFNRYFYAEIFNLQNIGKSVHQIISDRMRKLNNRLLHSFNKHVRNAVKILRNSAIYSNAKDSDIRRVVKFAPQVVTDMMAKKMLK